MARLMSVALTEDAVRERRKTVTRRLGWRAAQPGMPLTLVRKAMGRSRVLPDGRREVEPLVVVAHVMVVSTRWERLDAITDADVLREGFSHADLAPWWHDGSMGTAFVRFFCESMRCSPDTLVNRIEWEYVDGLTGVSVDTDDFDAEVVDQNGNPVDPFLVWEVLTGLPQMEALDYAEKIAGDDLAAHVPPF